MYLQCSHGFLGQYFSGWCFTHQYKNTTQFCFYAVPAASQNTKTSKTGHSHDDRYYTEAEINAKLAMTYKSDSIAVNASCVSRMGSNLFKCCGWTFGFLDFTLTSACNDTYTSYFLGTIPTDFRSAGGHACMTIISTDDKAGNGNPWFSIDNNRKLYLNVRNTALSGTRNYGFFIVPC